MSKSATKTIRSLTVLLALTTSLALPACGGSSSSASSSTSSPSNAKSSAAKSVPRAPAKGTSAKRVHGKERLLRIFEAFSSCMRANGVDYPKPLAAGHIRVHALAHLDRSTPQYKAARAKCARQISSLVR